MHKSKKLVVLCEVIIVYWIVLILILDVEYYIVELVVCCHVRHEFKKLWEKKKSLKIVGIFIFIFL
jgi:hypothetical protein